ncbi:MAG TPA: ATP-dependent Clp protease ATP-binding subunit [Ktedonobacteraceae bacterium]|nr:ATP-dependent Clp protease ATP-binding subunit [Ktedonobacteraceae bacterium]
MSRQNRQNQRYSYTEEMRQALAGAREEAKRLRHRTINTEHLLLGLLKLCDPFIEALFSSLHVSTQRIVQALDFVLGRGNKASLSDPTLTAAARAALLRAEEEALLDQSAAVDLEHLLLSLLSEPDSVAIGVLESFGVDKDSVAQQLLALRNTSKEALLLTNRYQARYDSTPMLNMVSRDLTLAALRGMLDPLIGREMLLERTMQILSRRSKNNPVLIGHAGVGKTAIAEGLALRIVQSRAPENLLHCRVVALDTGMLTVGTRFRGDFEERLKRIMQEIMANRGIILVIDELHALVGAGVAEGSIDAGNLFKPLLARGEFQCIGATTLSDYRKTIEADPALERRFQPVQVPETTPQETLEILHGLRSRYADFHHVIISDEALRAAVQMSSRYIASRYQPDKAIDLIDEASARVCVSSVVVPERARMLRGEILLTEKAKDTAIMQRNFAEAGKHRHRELQLHRELRLVEQEWMASRRQERPVVGKQQIAEVVSLWTGIPVTQIAAQEAGRLLRLEDELHRRVIGQDEAVRAVAQAVRRSRANIRDSRRPIGSFIFVGPTGVGKTELARALAQTLFGDENVLIKLDMSEFMESHQAARLIGAPPGYVGYDQAGQLTEAVRRRPYSIILFDEIEKAHPKVFDLLLQLLDDGCLTDSHGQTVDFRHTIVIITSNAGTAALAHSAIGFGQSRLGEPERRSKEHERVKATILPALKDLFKPELLNRIDEIVVFHPLQQQHLRQIVDLMIAQTQRRLAEQSITLQVSEAARHLLVRRGYTPLYGARPLRRAVQTLLEDPLAEAILQGTITSGGTILVDAANDELAIHPAELAHCNVAKTKKKLKGR